MGLFSKLGFIFLAVAVVVGVGLTFAPDLLDGSNEHTVLSMPQMQLAITAFCLNPQIENLGVNDQVALERTLEPQLGENLDFEKDGKISEDEYEKQSIYSVLYSLYASHPTLNYHVTNESYMFTFNTWGVAPSPYPETDPQRHGKAAYRALVEFDEVKEYLAGIEDPQILEVGCGTGAGANLISGELLDKCTYHAVDMQAAGIKTCNEFHRGVDGKKNPNLKCIHANGKTLDFAENSMDMVLISETHIAELTIGPEEKTIIQNIHRILKPGGFLVWGNAIPRTAYHELIDYLPEAGFKQIEARDVTEGGILARDEDEDRVNDVISQFEDSFYALKWMPSCAHVLDRLIKNFYRHPGTDLYNKMVTKVDIYFQIAYQSTKQK